MADMPKMSLYDVPVAPPMWDRVGIFYISFCATWTSLVLAGMTFCIVNRHNPIIKIRGLPLSFSAVALLHCYWILAQITYPIGRTMNVILAYDIQYFIMGIYFPLGIALFHASNLRFLHIAKLQKQFTHPALRSAGGCNGSKTSLLCRLRNLSYTAKVMVFIGIGMVAQIALTLGMWFACMKYHPTYGIPGTELKGDTIPEQLANLGRGWEWWPSVLWQVIWTWIVAPYLIWRAWGIRDTMGWRTQTIGCCVSNLHATPMFLIASYVPAFEKVNAYYTPSQWIHLSVMMFEIFTVFVPVFQVIRSWNLARKVNDSNARWETASQTSTLGSSSSDWKMSKHINESSKSVDYLDEELGDRLLTMSALEHVLFDNPAPLQEFSALNDFSGENIAFLTRAAKWTESWPVEPAREEDRLAAYNQALAIYEDFISPRDAEFPLNLSSKELKSLEEVFEKATRIVCGEARTNPAVPFDVEQALPRAGENNSQTDIRSAQYRGEIPEAFDMAIFGRVQSHIKYLVLTNTWPKFVAEMQSRRRSSESERSGFSAGSDTTLASRVSSRISSLLHSLF